VDSGFGEDDEIPAAYDSLIAKLVVWGATREQARNRMLRALDEYQIEGVPTTIPAHRVLLENAEFVDGSYTTRTVDGGALDTLVPDTTGPASGAHARPFPVLMVGDSPARLWNPAMAGSTSRATGAAASGGTPDRGAVTSPMHGTILKLLVAEGDEVRVGDPVAILEAMKMETHVASGASGRVTEVRVEPGAIVEAGEVVAIVVAG
jgi:acetyl-CoA/propionyl-CoA carboxylase biotin carboxyl carrier protein